MTKLKDVAEKANVSLATASLALNDSALISNITKERIKAWAKKLNYYPNIAAQRLAKRRSYNICLMLNLKNFFKASNIYYLRVIGGIIRKAENTEYTIKFAFYGEHESNNAIPYTNGSCDDRHNDFYNTDSYNSSNTSNSNTANTDSLKSKPDTSDLHHLTGFKRGDLNVKNVDGIIIFDVIEKEILNSLREEVNVPIILVDNHKSYPDIYGVDNDDFGGAYKATRYLLELGHKKIGYIGIPDAHPLGSECWNGFKRALDENGLKEFLTYKNCRLGIRSGRRAIEELAVNGSELPTAFFCINDFIAIGAIEELKRRGYKIPDDFSLIGMDDMDLSSEIEPPLTTVRINMEMLGQVGMEKLIAILNGSYDGEVKTIIDNEIIERKTCMRIQ